MGQYSEAEHCLGFIHRDILVDIYRRKKGATCCGSDYDLDEGFCFFCKEPLEPRDVYQICIAGVFIPGAESPDENGAKELAMYIIDEYPGALRDPEDCVLARLDLETDYEDDREEDDFPEPEPLPGSVEDLFNRALTEKRSGKRDDGRSDLLDSADRDDRITSELIEDALSGASVNIVPVQPPVRPGLGPPKDAARRAMLAKQIHSLKWWRKAQRLIDGSRKKK